MNIISYSRVINVSSGAYEAGRMNWDDLTGEKRSGYSAWQAYANSKLANVLHAKELARRAKDVGIVAFSVHPGLRFRLLSELQPTMWSPVTIKFPGLDDVQYLTLYLT